MIPETLTTGIIALGVGLGTGIAGAIIGRRSAHQQNGERRRENTPALIRNVVRETMTEVAEQHLGTKATEIRDSISRIEAFMTVSCPGKHDVVNERLNRLEGRKT